VFYRIIRSFVSGRFTDARNGGFVILH